MAAPAASASGHGTLFVTEPDGSMGRRQFSFNGKQTSGFNARGNAVLHNPAFTGENGQRYSLHVDILCINKIGNTVIFGGNTRRTNDPNLVDAVFFAVRDNGEPGNGVDEISSVYFWDDDPNTTGEPMACEFITELDMQTIEAGNVQVR